MKFYAYIADAKLDRLLAELSAEDRARLASELGVEPRVLDLPEVRRAEPDETRFARAAAIALHLEQSGRVSALDAEGEYVGAIGDVHWGRFRRVRGAELLVHETESPVAFGIAQNDRELIVIGSASKLLVQPPAAKIDEATRAPASPWYALVARADEADLDVVDRRCLEHAFAEVPPPSAANAPSEPKAFPPGSIPPETLARLVSEPWMEQLAHLCRDVRALPQGRLELLAKRVATFSGGNVDRAGARFEPAPPLVLASPLFVAMTL